MQLTQQEREIFQRAGRVGATNRWAKRTPEQRKAELAKVRAHKQPRKTKHENQNHP